MDQNLKFAESWASAEMLYITIKHTYVENILKLMNALRSRGYDKNMRAGTSLYTFILSRSLEHGLKEGQAYVAFSFDQIGGTLIVRNGRHSGRFKEFRFDSIAFNETIDLLLQELNAAPLT